MQKFLAGLIQRIVTAKTGRKSPMPQDELQPGDEVIGDLPDDLKCLYIVFINYLAEVAKQCKACNRRIAKLFRSLTKTPPGAIRPEDLAFVAQHNIMHKRVELLQAIFWQGVREAFPEATMTATSIGLRKGWQVVVSRPAQPRIEVWLNIGL